jgi:hypothetical protein
MGFSKGTAASVPPSDYTVIATDGSQIDVDRHGPVHCFLINIGVAQVRYGKSPAAELSARPVLGSRPEELAFRDPEDGLREQAIEGPLLGLKRSVMEASELAGRLAAAPQGMPAVGLLDGSLVLWELSGDRYADFVREELLNHGLLAALDSLRKLSNQRECVFGSYISRPRSTEVVNLLRAAWCPHELEVYGCDQICGKGGAGSKECNEVALGLMDRELFEEVLQPGERSAVFHSQSPIVLREYREHPISFFYLHTGQEIARIELPRWQAEEPEALDLLHGVILDQCRKGMGYPIALQEAHERAVVTMADRRAFWAVVQSTLEARGMGMGGSLKSRSKRVRAV